MVLEAVLSEQPMRETDAEPVVLHRASTDLHRSHYVDARHHHKPPLTWIGRQQERVRFVLGFFQCM